MKQHFIEIPWAEFGYYELPDDERDIVDRAIVALRQAYAPYSHYLVGAAVCCRDGSVFTGQNTEEHTYTGTEHAERAALSNANNAGKGDQVIKLACIGEQKGNRLVAPCGGCLDRMLVYEYRARRKMVILFGGCGGKTFARVIGVRTLIPLSFIPEDLHGQDDGSAYDGVPAARD